jgi:hypothetical protein
VSLRALALLLLGAAPLETQVGRHPQPGIFIQAGGGLTMADAEPRYGPRFGPQAAIGVGWTSAGGLAVAAHLEHLRYRVDPDLDLAITQLAFEPAWYVSRRDYTAVFVGGRALVGIRRTGHTWEFLDPAAAAGRGFGLVAGARSQASPRVGFSARVSANWLWFGDVRAGGLRVANTRAPATHFGALLAVTFNP